MPGERWEREPLIGDAPEADGRDRGPPGDEVVGRVERDREHPVVRDRQRLADTGAGRDVPEIELPPVAPRGEQRAVVTEGDGEHRTGARRDRATDATARGHVP